MRAAAKLLGRIDAVLAALEAALLALLLMALATGGLAQVLEQNSSPALARSLAPVAGLAGLLFLASGAALSLWRRGGRWGSVLALAGLATLLFAGALRLGSGLDYLLRAAVLWIGLVGASLATRRREHITIEALGKLLPQSSLRWIECGVGALAAALLVALCGVALDWVADSRASGEVFFTLQDPQLAVRKWWLKLSLPLGLGVMAWRFGLLTLGACLDEPILPRRAAAAACNAPSGADDAPHSRP